MNDLHSKSLLELNALLSKRKVSCRDIIQSFLKRIELYNDKLNAFYSVLANESIKEANRIDKEISSGKQPGPLTGIPLAVKNNINTKNIETNCASRILKGFIPPFDSTAIERLKNAGMIILGKTNLDEFAMGSSTENSAFGPTRNPWDIERTPGGSSGGSVAAVAAGMAPAALGSETGGSVRQPASFCGITGLKPTYGRVSRYGLVAFGSSLDQIGPAARTAEDIAWIMKQMSGWDRYDSTSSKTRVDDYPSHLSNSIKGKKIGIPKEYFAEGLSSEVKEAIENCIKILIDGGCEVMDISLPHTSCGIAVYYIIAPAEASSNLARYDGIRYGFRADGDYSLKELYSVSRDLGFGPEVKRRIMLGTYVLSAGYYDAYYLKAQKVRTLIKRDFETAFKEVDFIITPTTPTTAFKLGDKVDNPLEMYLSDIYTANVNLAGIPAISIPVGFDKKNLPIGAQIIGKWFDEMGILNLAHYYQQNTQHHLSFPNM